MGTSGEEVEVRQTPDLEKLRRDLQVIRICARMYMRPAGLCVVHVCFDWWAPSFLQHFTVSSHVHPHHAVFAISVMLAGYKGAPFTLSSCVNSVCVVGMVGLAKQRSGLAHSSPKPTLYVPQQGGGANKNSGNRILHVLLPLLAQLLLFDYLPGVCRQCLMRASAA